MPDVAEGKSLKLLLPRGAVDCATLRWRSGLGIEMAWDASLTPYVGIWICNGDLGGYSQVATSRPPAATTGRIPPRPRRC